MAGKSRRRVPTSTPAIRRAQNVTLATAAMANLGQQVPERFDPKRMPADRIAQNGHHALALMRDALGLDESLFTASLREIRAHVMMVLRGDEIVDAEFAPCGIDFRYRLTDQTFPALWKGRIELSFDEFLPLTVTGPVAATTAAALRAKASKEIDRRQNAARRTAADLRYRFAGMFDRDGVEPLQLVSVDDVDMDVAQMDALVARYVAMHHAGDHAAEERRRMAIEDPRLLHLDAPVAPRRVLALLGPTNSGKTHEGLNLLCASESGAYLGPLRLMALENHEAIVGRGVACSLLTGEEEILDPDARHVSATVEMFQQSVHWDTVLIDEIQTIAEPDRGWAWSRAFLSASTDLLIVAGSPDAEPLIRRLAEMNGDTLEVRLFERRNALHVSAGKATWETIRKGDALVAFSRDDVLAYKSMAESRGFKAAAVYGALGPEARHEQARRFREGEADILVATDAIGMGLNLPIDRVVLTRLDKWDGHEVRPLTSSEARQIGGRAGRFSSTCPGEVIVMTGAGKPEKLAALMNAPSLIDVDGPLPMQPGWAVVSRVISERGLTLEAALSLIANALIGHPDASYTVTDDVLEILHLVKGPLYTPQDRFRHLGLPLSMRAIGNKTMLAGWVRLVNAGKVVPAPTLAGLKPGATADTYELRRIEDAVQQAGAYMWLGRRFPDSYPQIENARDTRTVGTEYITAILSQKKLKRPCSICGNGLPLGHRHSICDPCFDRGREED